MALTLHEKANLIKSTSKLSGGTIKKAYYKHAVIYGDYMDLRIYNNVKITHNGNKNIKSRGQHGNKRNDSIARAKVKLFRLVIGNAYKHGRTRPIFATYTFEEPIADINLALIVYRRYLRRLQTHVGYNLRYITVPQIQWKRYKKYGVKVWHFHTIFFNVPKLEIKKNDQMWSAGMVKLEFPKGIKNLGAYIAGYMTKKDFEEIPFNRRFYYASRGLLQPLDLFHIDQLQKLQESSTLKLLSTYRGYTYIQLKYKLC